MPATLADEPRTMAPPVAMSCYKSNLHLRPHATVCNRQSSAQVFRASACTGWARAIESDRSPVKRSTADSSAQFQLDIGIGHSAFQASINCPARYSRGVSSVTPSWRFGSRLGAAHVFQTCLPARLGKGMRGRMFSRDPVAAMSLPHRRIQHLLDAIEPRPLRLEQ